MARYLPFGMGKRPGRDRRLLYAILPLLIFAVVVAFIYRHPFGKSKEEPIKIVNDPNVGRETVPLVLPRAVETEPNLSKIVIEPTSEPDPKAAKLIAEAMALKNASTEGIIHTRDRLNKVLAMPMSNQQRAFIKKQLSELCDKWLFSKAIFGQDVLCGRYRVKPGDQFTTIGRQFKVPWQILLQINKIQSPEQLPAGEVIKVIHGPFHARIYRSTFTMDLYLQNTFVRSFRVGLGRPEMETPTGLWRVKVGGKLVKPVWTNPLTGKTHKPTDPDYPLGSRWIGLEGIEGDAKGREGFAIHGTKKPEEIGTRSSQGCIRLHNGDAILMYNLLVPFYSQVEVVE
jgi:LysM repeat protein